MEIGKADHVAFAITMIGVGILGIFNPDLMPVWSPVPGTGPAHQLLLYVGIGVSLLSGIGLLVRRTTATATRLLLAALSIWMLLMRLPNFARIPLFAACWSVFPLAVILSATLVLYVRFATAWDHERLRSLSSISVVGKARVLYGLSLIFFGVAHFIDVKDTLSLVPRWLPGHLFWAYFTGGAFIAAGLAVVTGFWARLAAAMSALEIASFLFLVWVPIVAAGSTTPSQRSETILNAALLAAACIVANSYSGTWRVERLPGTN